MDAIANAGGGGGTTIDASTQLAVAGVTASGDISARDVTVTQELHVDGAAVLNGTLTVAGTNVMSALAAKQDALTASTALSCTLEWGRLRSGRPSSVERVRSGVCMVLTKH